jgi:hypothetical protein
MVEQRELTQPAASIAAPSPHVEAGRQTGVAGQGPRSCATADKQRSGGRSGRNLRLVDTEALAKATAGPSGCSTHQFTPAKLEAFVAVAEGGGLSAAARRLHISQSALSQTINGLERQPGVELMIRSRNSIHQRRPLAVDVCS